MTDEAGRNGAASGGFAGRLGAEVGSAEEGSARPAFEATDEHLNPAGTLHGGVLATLVDTAMGMAVRSATGDDDVPATSQLDRHLPAARGARPGRGARAQVRTRGSTSPSARPRSSRTAQPSCTPWPPSPCCTPRPLSGGPTRVPGAVFAPGRLTDVRGAVRSAASPVPIPRRHPVHRPPTLRRTPSRPRVPGGRGDPRGTGPGHRRRPGAAGESVECPECGEQSAPLSVVTWGHCRACRTAQSREIYPLRW